MSGGLAGVALVGVPVDFGGTFRDPAVADTHTATLDWGDGSALQDFGGGDVVSPLGASHVYASPGDYTVAFEVTDDDGGVTTVTAGITVFDAAGAVETVLDDIDGRLATETDPSVLEALQQVRAHLDGNDDGAEGNGANDKLATEDYVAALVMIGKAIQSLDDSEATGGADATDLKLLLALSARSVAQGVFDEASAYVGPAPSNGEQKQLDKIEGLIQEGSVYLASSLFGAAIESFEGSVKVAVRLLP